MIDDSQGDLFDSPGKRDKDENNYLDESDDEEPLQEWLEDDEYEEIDVGVKKALMINPDGTFKVYWDNIVMFMIIYIILVFPFKLSYFSLGLFMFWDYADDFIDFVFLVDLVLNFFTPVFYQNKFIQEYKEVAKLYLRFWFWVDLLSAIPFDLMFGDDPKNSTNGIINYFFTIPRLYKMLRSLKLLRITRLFRTSNKNFLTRFFQYLADSDSLIISIMPIYIIGFSVAYVFSCIWHFNSNNNHERNTWLVRFQYNAESVHDRFWASLYYTYSTVTTTGYGDLTPNSVSEFVLTIGFMTFGVVFYSLVYTMIIQKFD